MSALSLSYFHKQLSVLFFRKCFKQPLFTILISFDHTISFKLHKLNSNKIKEEFNWVIIKNIKKSITLGKKHITKSITTMIRSIMIATSIMIMINNIMITTKSMMTMIKSITMITIIITKKSIMMTMIIIMILSNHIKNITKSLKRLLIPRRHTGGFFMIFIDDTQIFL
ncbi:hypothetical protein Q433_10420 [Bacillus subtilis subsp. subtilis str. OH 131.1]|nr:hypothetical protein Q433_10420 [Bacillus subtilis subsp. subtilis str. OH 131.1]